MMWRLPAVPFSQSVRMFFSALLLLILPLKIYSAGILQRDSLILMNGLRVYLYPSDEASATSIRLIINAGKRNESECQVGYSEVIRQLIGETLNGRKELFVKKPELFRCEIANGRLVVGGDCPVRSLNSEIAMLSRVVVSLNFKKERVDRAVAVTVDDFRIEHISSYRLSELYRDLVLYGAEHPLGRSYCQYQLEKMLPDELKEFYCKQYTPGRSTLVICGNFKVSEVKKTVAKQFARWRSIHKEKKGSNDADRSPIKIKNREIAFVSKRDSKLYMLRWVQPAPMQGSPEQLAFLAASKLFEQCVLSQLSEREGSADTLIFSPPSYHPDRFEVTCIASQNGMTNAIDLFDTTLATFQRSAFNASELDEAIKHIGNRFTSAEVSSGSGNPFDYSNSPGSFSGICLRDIQRIKEMYFKPDAYRLIIIGKETAASNRMGLKRKVIKYQVSDFETCDESCVVHNKKKWKKGHQKCCFKCFMRGWCPCMFSPARLQ
jgi:predicted Zn-dependent peptidase